jgi:hypothetical protein
VRRKADGQVRGLPLHPRLSRKDCRRSRRSAAAKIAALLAEEEAKLAAIEAREKKERRV